MNSQCFPKISQSSHLFDFPFSCRWDIRCLWRFLPVSPIDRHLGSHPWKMYKTRPILRFKRRNPYIQRDSDIYSSYPRIMEALSTHQAKIWTVQPDGDRSNVSDLFDWKAMLTANSLIVISIYRMISVGKTMSSPDYMCKGSGSFYMKIEANKCRGGYHASDTLHHWIATGRFHILWTSPPCIFPPLLPENFWWNSRPKKGTTSAAR